MYTDTYIYTYVYTCVYTNMRSVHINLSMKYSFRQIRQPTYFLYRVEQHVGVVELRLATFVTATVDSPCIRLNGAMVFR